MIYFYKVNEPFGCFSNFSPHGFYLEEKYWKTSEHYFQAQKFLEEHYREEVRLAKTPMEAAILGRNRRSPLRNDWESIKDDVMHKAVLQKFQTHEDIRLILLSTGEEELIEKTSTDYYWGCGDRGNGKNKLGKILMEIRALLRG